ncbi:MAG: multidrug transporter [Anaerolineae bacterium]|nr:MAG: multidrug transporter [Anaerolineae bacterium]MCL4877267.1 multidrug transporter [Anaerolineae bacterium]
MRKFVIAEEVLIHPFNEPARELSVLDPNGKPVPLGLHLNDLVESVIGKTSLEVSLTNENGGIFQLKDELERPRYGLRPDDEVVVYRDNLYFDREFFVYFLQKAQASGRPCQAALPADDYAWQRYSIPLTNLRDYKGSDDRGEFYKIDLYYFPRGWAEPVEWQVVRVPSDAKERGYYNVPDSMSNLKLQELESGDSLIRRDQDLTHFLSWRSCVPIQSWVHIFNANIPLGVFSRGFRFEETAAKSNLLTLKILWRSILEQRQFVSCSELVKVGKNCDIDPSAVILGPTTIGDNCKIGAGVVIDNCVIGDNTTLANNCHLMLSVVGANCFLPFRAALFMTTMMDYTIVAQNTCLQMCVLGRNSFVGAGTTFTDFNLLPSPIKAMDAYGEMSEVGQAVLGGCVGHNVRVGAGMIVFPGRTIESDVILIASADRRVIGKGITYDMSDHLTLDDRVAALHSRLYSRRTYMGEEDMLEEW